MRYKAHDKQEYLYLCRKYNLALRRLGGPKSSHSSTRFVRLSVQLFAAKGLVPKSWRQPCFIKRCGWAVMAGQ